MNKTLKYLLSEPGKSQALVQLRERLLKVMLVSSFVVGSVLFALATIPALQKGLYVTILIYGILYVLTILITFVKRFPYRARAIGWLGMLYIFGCINLYLNGFNVDAGLFLITFIAMAILLMDLAGGLAALVLGCLTVSISALVNVAGHYQIPMGLPQSDLLVWVIGGTIFLLMGILLIYSQTTVVTGLEENLAKTTRLANELENTNVLLRMSEARYRTLVETSPGLVVLLDLNGNIVMVNHYGLDLFGYESLEEVKGKHLTTFIAPADQRRVASLFEKTLDVGEQKEFECLTLRKNQVPFFAEFNAALVVDEGGKPQSVIGVGRDISAHKETERLLWEARDTLAAKVDQTTFRLRQTTDRLEELVKHGPTVIFSYRPSDHGMTYVSENVSALLGYQAAQFTDDIYFWRDHLHPDERESLLNQMDQPDNQERSVFDYRFLKSDGTYCWLRGERMLQRDMDGTPLEYVGSWSDITERKHAEDTLKNSEARYRSLYESMMDAYVEVDLDGRIQRFNRSYESMLGYEPDELRKLTYMDLTPERWHDFEAEITKNQIWTRGYSEIYEKEYIRKDGTIFPVELRSALMRDESGNPFAMWAFVRDISERKIIEQTLRESEGRYRELLENSMQGVIVFQDMRVAYVNQAITDALGYTQNEIKSLSPADIIMLVHPDDRAMFQARLQARLDNVPTPARYSLRVMHKNGEIRWVEARTVSMEFQGRPALMTTAIDVSDIKKAEAALQESERVQKTILNASDALVFLLDTDGTLITSNDKFSKRMGIEASSLAGTSLYDILPEEVARARKVPFDQVLSSGKPITYIDSREGIWFENNLYPVMDGSGKVVRVAVFARDITEQRRVSEALRASEEQYRELAEAAHDMIFIINRDDRIQYVNSFGSRFLGRPPEQLVGQPRAHFFPIDTSDHQENNIQQVFQTGEAVSAESANKFFNQTIWLNTWLVPLKDASGEVTSVLGVSRDITERKKAEEALQQARDLLEERVTVRTKELLASQEKLRILTAQTITAQEEERRVISRELHDEAGQALITLKYGLAAIQSELPESDSLPRRRLADSMKIIDQTMLHIRALSHRLRPPVLEIGGINLSLQELCREITDRTKIPVYYEGLEIPGLPDEMGISLFRFVQEALTNILKHAHATEVKVRLQYQKRGINLSVADNGRGIEDSLQSEGLGLMGIKERLALLGGKLEVHSQKGRGTKLVAHVPWLGSNIG